MFNQRESDATAGRIAGEPSEPDDPTFLVVDDNEDNRATLGMKLDILGFSNVIMAENGREALERMRRERIDIVLLDIMMPELDGYAVLSEMKADTRLRDISVIMISAIEDMTSVVRCIELGASDYLTKPFNPVLLKARVSNFVDKARYKRQEVAYRRTLEAEKKRADELLATVLPKPIVRALKTKKTLAPQRYENVAVLFCDVVGFTAYSAKHPPEHVFARLEALVNDFEVLAQRYELEKIKTIGDAFMATAGLLEPHEDPIFSAVTCGLEMVAATVKFDPEWQVRIGIDFGPVSAGIMGKTQFQFDVWGDTVNTAARIEACGRPGSVNISARAWPHLRDRIHGRSLGLVDLKGKQKIEILECVGLRE
jgi:class 3 adenylate cyclase